MIKARRVRFDWSQTPMHWVPGDPQTTHTMNVLHLLLPAGERWFCDVYREVLPLVTSEPLRADVKGFIGQEAVHARAHAAVLEHLAAHGLDCTPYTRRVDWLFGRVLGDTPFGVRWWPARWGRFWLQQRLAIIAAIEHFTAVLGVWIIERSSALDRAGADPTMLDLLRWHGAEEVEHRSVAFDAFQHVSGNRLRRSVAMVGSFVAMTVLWVIGVRFLMRHDPELAVDSRRPSLRAFWRAGREGKLPTAGELAGAVPRYLRADHHPSQEGSTEAALAYLARSPAASAYAVAS